MKKARNLSIILAVFCFLQYVEAAPAEAGKQGEETSQALSFDTFQAAALDQKRPYGLGVDQFFGAAAMMQKAGQFSPRNPIPLLQKTLEGLSKNEYEGETLQVIMFTFSRLALNNPAVIQAYRNELEKNDGDAAGILVMILWYAQDKQIQAIFRRLAQEETDPERKELYRKVYQNRTFANILLGSMPIKSCLDIELLWGEYFAKGDLEAIERIADQVTGESEGPEQALIRVEAGSSLAQRGGWFEEVRQLCEARQARASGRDRAIWEDITGRMKTLGDGTEIVNWPIKRIQLNGKEGRAMACEAVFPKKDNGRLDVLGAYSLKGNNIEHTREILSKWWFDGGRFELLMTMEWLLESGHRVRFDKETKQILHMNESQRKLFISRKPILDWPKWNIVCEYGPRMGDKSILAWDLSRVCMLGRFGYEAQYLTPLEVYRVSIPTAIVLQETFDSWDDYGENFWVGRWYWRAREEDRDKAKKAVEALLTEAGSPWKKYAWDMPMK